MLRTRPALALAFLLGLAAPAAHAQTPPADRQIAAAVTPAPSELQAGAAVLGYDAGGRLVTLREGSNDLVCLADDPGDDRFHVACYHRSLEPFMARGRALRAEGRDRDEIQRIREEEIASGALPVPKDPASLYQFFGESGSFDAATGTVRDARRLTVIYMPYATAESTGLPTAAPAGQPWLMNPGTPWAHVMLVEPQPEDAGADEDEDEDDAADQ